MRQIAWFLIYSLGLAACGPAAPPSAELSVEARLDGNEIRVSGTTNLPDGALLSYELRHEHLEIDPETPIHMLFADGTIPVAEGRFEATLDVSNFDPGTIEVWVAFPTDLPDGQQPADVVARYGERGERLEGPDVIDLGPEGRRLEWRTTVDR